MPTLVMHLSCYDMFNVWCLIYRSDSFLGKFKNRRTPPDTVGRLEKCPVVLLLIHKQRFLTI